MRRLALVALVVVAGCGGTETVDVVLEGSGGTVTVRAEVADSPAERSRGLSGREELSADGGMLFRFGEPTTARFWMKDTLVPLSVAFADATGRIVAIRDMAPCRRDPCPTYSAGRPYTTALEVNRGAFASWGIGVGDRMRLSD